MRKDGADLRTDGGMYHKEDTQEIILSKK